MKKWCFIKTWTWGLGLFFAIGLMLAGCGDDGLPATDAGPDQGTASLDRGVSPDLTAADRGTSDLPPGDAGATLPSLKPGWTILYPGGKTLCSRGTKYAFGVHPGKVNRLVVDFEGGGACWTFDSCAVSSLLFKDDVTSTLKRAKDGYKKGIYDKTNPQNPLKDWFHVFVPYCTGDIHWGNAQVTYTSKDGRTSFKINHRGAVNAQSVMDWIYKHFSAPEKIFVTGCSAGSYGSIMWASKLAHHYPNAKIYQFGDSGAGVITKTFLKDSFPVWNALATTPSWIPAFDPKKVNLLTKDMAYIYEAISNFYKSQVFSQFNRLADKVQVAYFQAMGGGTAAAWTRAMLTSIFGIEKAAPGFRAFVSAGTDHCVVPFDSFYTEKVGNRKLVDWISDMINDKPIKNLHCSTCKLAH